MPTVKEYIANMDKAVDQTMYGNLSDSIKMRSNIAIGTAGIFFLYAIAKQKSWITYTLIGLILGAGIGWLADEFKEEIDSLKP